MQLSVKQEREKYIGGSDIPSIMNISEFRSRYDLLREKAGIVKNNFEGNIYTEYGIKMEATIRDYINKFYKFENDSVFVEGHHIKESPIIDFRCHTDGENKNAILEIKTTSRDHKGVYHMSVHDLLLTNYMDYLVQTLFYMKIAGKRLGVIAVYNRPDDLSEEFDSARLHLYWFTLDEFKDISNKIDEDIEKFKADLIRLKENPDLMEVDFLPNEIKKMYQGVELIENKLQMYKQIENEFEAQKENLRCAMTRAGIKSFRTKDGTLVTAVDAVQSRVVEKEEFDTLKFCEEHPRLGKKYMVTKCHTVNGKKAYLKITFAKEKKS